MDIQLYRLIKFDVLHGYRIALTVLRQQFGWTTALKYVAKLQWMGVVKDPFKAVNKVTAPSSKQVASQYQVKPAILLYKILRQDGYSQEQALRFFEQVIEASSLAFLRYTVPIIEQSDYVKLTTPERLSVFKQITDYFPNAEGQLSQSGNRYAFTVNTCHFVKLCHDLGVPEIAPVFCKMDQRFFDNDQPNVVFFRTTTLASGQKSCDFAFELRE